MALWLRDGSSPPQKALEIIVARLHRVTTPMYLGALSLEVGYNLRQTGDMVAELERRGLVRRATAEEKLAHAMQADGEVYVLTEPASPAKARL